jgi:hypothetical protein
MNFLVGVRRMVSDRMRKDAAPLRRGSPHSMSGLLTDVAAAVEGHPANCLEPAAAAPVMWRI